MSTQRFDAYIAVALAFMTLVIFAAGVFVGYMVSVII